MRKIWPIEAILLKEHAVTRLHTSPILFVVWAEFWASSWAQFFVAIRPFEFSIFTNPIFGCRTIFGNLDFIQILITKYAIGSLKAMRIFLFSYSLIYIYVYIYIDRLYMWPQDILVFLIENKFLCFFQIGKLI